MDMSKLKWVVIIAIVVGVGWLMTEGGVTYMYKNFTKAITGEDEEQDKRDEAGLTRLAGYLLMTYRYDRAKEVYETAIKRYPDGKNAWFNYYKLARCEQKLGNYQTTADILHMLWDRDADQFDERVPNRAILEGRGQRLVEVHDLQPYK